MTGLEKMKAEYKEGKANSEIYFEDTFEEFLEHEKEDSCPKSHGLHDQGRVCNTSIYMCTSCWQEALENEVSG